MKNHTNMGIECAYSFEELYKAAFGRSLTKKEKLEFQESSQEEINNLVLVWAQKAKWTTDKRSGTDGREYIAFYPL